MVRAWASSPLRSASDRVPCHPNVGGTAIGAEDKCFSANSTLVRLTIHHCMNHRLLCFAGISIASRSACVVLQSSSFLAPLFPSVKSSQADSNGYTSREKGSNEKDKLGRFG